MINCMSAMTQTTTTQATLTDCNIIAVCCYFSRIVTDYALLEDRLTGKCFRVLPFDG